MRSVERHSRPAPCIAALLMSVAAVEVVSMLPIRRTGLLASTIHSTTPLFVVWSPDCTPTCTTTLGLTEPGAADMHVMSCHATFVPDWSLPLETETAKR